MQAARWWKGVSPIFRHRDASPNSTSLPSLGGIVHTLHSCHRMGAGGLAIPALGTTHADYFFADIPCTRGLSEEEVQGEYELNTGKVIIENARQRRAAAYAGNWWCISDGPFAWGKIYLRRGA